MQECTARFVQIAAVSERATDANDFVTFKWTCNQTASQDSPPSTTLLPGSGRGNSRLCFVGQLMNHLMENAIPDFRFVCPWLALSLGLMSSLVPTSPFRSILNCCHIFALGIGFFYWPHAMCAQLVYWLPISRLAEITLILVG